MMKIKWFLLIAIFNLFLTGCGVSSFKAQNWQASDPEDPYRSKNLDICRRLAEQDQIKNAGNLESPNKYANINKSQLTSCMQARGYKLREISGKEMFITVVTTPVVVPLMIMGKNYEDTY